MSNKDLLKLENEFKDELPRYREKPKIGPVPRPEQLKSKISGFLEEAKKGAEQGHSESSGNVEPKEKLAVEMDIYLTPT